MISMNSKINHNNIKEENHEKTQSYHARERARLGRVTLPLQSVSLL